MNPPEGPDKVRLVDDYLFGGLEMFVGQGDASFKSNYIGTSATTSAFLDRHDLGAYASASSADSSDQDLVLVLVNKSEAQQTIAVRLEHGAELTSGQMRVLQEGGLAGHQACKPNLFPLGSVRTCFEWCCRRSRSATCACALGAVDALHESPS